MRKEYHNKYFSIDLDEQLSALFNPKQYNWVDFNFVHLSCELDRIHGTWEVELYLLGLGVRLYGIYNNKVHDKAMKRYSKMLENSDSWVKL